MTPAGKGRLTTATILTFVALSGSCSSGSGPSSEHVTDALGRKCTIEDAYHVTCDQAPAPAAGCPSSASACFLMEPTADASGPAAICAGCCSGTTSSAKLGDCSRIVCVVGADCPVEYGRCLSGECRY